MFCTFDPDIIIIVSPHNKSQSVSKEILRFHLKKCGMMIYVKYSNLNVLYDILELLRTLCLCKHEKYDLKPLVLYRL